MSDNRTTIRNLDRAAMDELRSLALHAEMTVGEAVSEAIRFWLSSLPVGIATKGISHGRPVHED